MAAGWILSSGHQRVTSGREALAYSMLSFLSMISTGTAVLRGGTSMTLLKDGRQDLEELQNHLQGPRARGHGVRTKPKFETLRRRLSEKP